MSNERNYPKPIETHRFGCLTRLTDVSAHRATVMYSPINVVDFG
jgi:hypothetical protein